MEFPACIHPRKSFVYRTTFYRCHVCPHKKQDYTSVQMECHLKLQTHKENMEQYYCQPCQLQCYKPSIYNRHLETKGHKQKTGEIPVDSKEDLKCDVCDVKFMSNNDKLRHLATNKHKQNAGILPKPDLKCEACGVRFLCKRAMEIHNETRKHKSKTVS